MRKPKTSCSIEPALTTYFSCDKGYQGTFLGAHAGSKVPHNEHGGCFSKIMRVEERFVMKIPDCIPMPIAAPLMCGGNTVFEPICDYVQPGSHVAVASIGGLGTLAIKLAKAYGGHVTALSRNEAKREKCLSVGAKEFYACLGNTDKMKELSGKFDLIIDTSPANAELAPYMDMLKFNGVYCRVGIPQATDQDFTYSYIPLIFTEKKIAGSVVTGTLRAKKMLDIVADDPDTFVKEPSDWNVSVVPFAQINEMMDNLVSGKNTSNYRYVLEW